MLAVSRINRFDGSNFLVRKNCVYSELECELLTKYVEKAGSTDDKKQEDWIKGNAKAKKVIVKNLADGLLYYAPIFSTAYKIWKKLNTTFQPCSYLQRAYLCRRLANLRYDGKGDLNSFFSRLTCW